MLEANRDVLVAGVLSDALDEIGARGQVLPGWVTNHQGNQLLGKARTIQLATGRDNVERFDLTLGLIDGMNKDEVLIIGGLPEIAYFGEMMATFSLERKIRGALIDGATRDSLKTREIALPVFAKSYSPIDIKGRGFVESVDRAVELGGHVTCLPGDLVYADTDAVVVIPSELAPALYPVVKRILAEERKISDSIAKGYSAKRLFTEFDSF